MEQQRSEVISGIRACLISTKGKVPLKQLEADYRTLVGERIPYFKLGYKRLEDFLQSEPTLVISRNSNGDVLVDARLSEKSAHITEMVHYQKSEKKKVLKKAVRFAPSYYPAATANWRPRNANYRDRKFQTSSRPAAVSHNQFVTRPSYNKPSVPSKVVVPDSSSFYRNQPQRTMQPRKADINTRLHVPQTSQDNRQVGRNGLTVTIQNDSGENKENSDVCSPLSSTKKRLSKKMSEMSIDRDSGNSSPTSDTSAPANAFPDTPSEMNLSKTTEFVRTGDPIEDLKKFVETYKVGELEVSSKLMKTKRNRMFTCKIKVSKHIYTSYPEEFDSPLAAEKYCAEEALKDLIPKYGRRKSLLLASNKDILERIPPMLEKHNHGIWISQLQLDYADKYNEQLPVDWLTVIDSSPCIQVERCLDNYVLRHCKPGDRSSQEYGSETNFSRSSQKGLKWNNFMTLSDVSVPSNTVQFGEDGRLYAEVTCVMSANEIWCRQYSTEESNIYSEMIGRMEAFYSLSQNQLRPEKIATAGYYIARYDNTWYRIRAVSVQDSVVQCFFIDYGDEMAIPKSEIYQLKREFALSQAQAFVCRLVGLEDLYGTSQNSEVLQSLMYKQVILEMATDSIFEDNNSGDLSIPVFMYDCSTGNSINQEMIPLLTIESASPVIKKDIITEVYRSNIEANGDVYIQLHSHGYDSLQVLLANLESQVLNDPPTNLITPITKQNSVNRLYFAKYKVDSHWYRVRIIDWSPNEELAQIYFVDYGNTDVVNVKDDIMYPLDKLSEVLSQYPAQAVKVKMLLEHTPSDLVDLASKAMPVDQPVLLKIVDYDSDNVPIVEFFKRNSDGGLFCINKSITMEAELKKGDGNNNLKSAKRKLAQFDGAGKNVPSGGSLQRPDLPKVKKYYQVHVPFAVNPYNFFVQPLESRPKLHKMMEQLQERYKDVLYSPLMVDQIVPGNIYASKHDDGYWYRTSVIKVIHSGSISVFYCDFGYYANLTVQQLIPLDIEFMELPYQALKAKLANIKPKQSKWTVEDCEYFKSCVEKKVFFSVLLEIEKDELYESDIVLKLILIDTSSEQDVYIGEELIKKGIAVEA